MFCVARCSLAQMVRWIRGLTINSVGLDMVLCVLDVLLYPDVNRIPLTRFYVGRLKYGVADSKCCVAAWCTLVHCAGV